MAYRHLPPKFAPQTRCATRNIRRVATCTMLPMLVAFGLSSPVVAQSAPEADPDYEVRCDMMGFNGMIRCL